MQLKTIVKHIFNALVEDGRKTVVLLGCIGIKKQIDATGRAIPIVLACIKTQILLLITIRNEAMSEYSVEFCRPQVAA